MGPSTDHGSCLSFYHLNTWSVVFCMKIGKLWRQNDVNLAKIRHVFDYNLLTDVVLEHNLQIYSKAQWSLTDGRNVKFRHFLFQFY